jgi:hypothetical protein
MDNVERIDYQLLQTIGKQETITQLWSMMRDVVLERLTRKSRRKRTSIAQPKLLEWVECVDPEMSLGDIPVHSRSRVEDLDELENYLQRKNLMLEGKVRP